MDKSTKLGLLQRQVAAANDGQPEDLSAWRTATANALRLTLGNDHVLSQQFNANRYSPMVYSSTTPRSTFDDASRAGVLRGVNYLRAAIEEIELTSGGDESQQRFAPRRDAPVFLVHGHSQAHLQQAARASQQLTHSDPVILHERPSGGRTIIEKLEAHGEASFAVVLLTADDLGKAIDEESLKSRARQNVWFEAGYFFGRLGRQHVVLLHEPRVDIPSDLFGIIYISLDEGGAWRYQLGNEMRDAGLDVNLHNLR